MNTKAAANPTLEITRQIKAPRQRVYEAWTDPAQLKRWFGPEDVQTKEFVGDVRVGGKYRWDLVHSDGEKMSAFGEYRELIPGKKVVFTWQWDDDEAWENVISIVTVDLAERNGGTELTLKHEELPSEESRDRHTGGWNSILDKLESCCWRNRLIIRRTKNEHRRCSNEGCGTLPEASVARSVGHLV